MHKILLAALLLLSTYAQCETNCLVADTTTIVDSEKNIFLVYRVAGLQDKIEFFEIYDHKPEFDSCGKSVRPPLASEPIENSKGFLKQVIWKNRTIQIVYTTAKATAVSPKHIKLKK